MQPNAYCDLDACDSLSLSLSLSLHAGRPITVPASSSHRKRPRERERDCICECCCFVSSTYIHTYDDVRVDASWRRHCTRARHAACILHGPCRFPLPIRPPCICCCVVVIVISEGITAHAADTDPWVPRAN
jgi:hypothetical protein